MAEVPPLLPTWSAKLVFGYFFWPARISSLVEFFENKHDATPQDATIANSDGKAAFIEYAQSLLPDHPHEDVRPVATEVWTNILTKGPLAALREILKLCDVELRFELGEAIVATSSASAWIDLTAKLDVDALVAAQFTAYWSENHDAVFTYAPMGKPLVAPAFGAPDLATDEKNSTILAGVVPRMADADLDIVLSAGIADTHVHFGGLRSPHILWQRIALGDTKLNTLDAFQHRRGDGHDAGRGLRRRLIEQTLDAMVTAYPHVIELQISAPSVPRREPCQRLNERLLEARRHLIGLMQLADQRGSANNAWREQRALDLLITAKSLFVHEFQQAPKSTPGLAAFRRYYGSGRARVGNLRRPASRSPRFVAETEHADAAYFLIQSRSNLRRVELRLQPTSDVHSLVHFFRSWDRVEQLFDLPRLGLDVTFSFHLLRSASAADGTKPSDAADRSNLSKRVGDHAAFDRVAAALHKFRNHPSCLAWARKVRRVDLAGQERDATPELAAFPMRLLRSDRDALTALDPDTIDKTAHRAWLHLKSINQATAHPRLPALRLCCHAGEDHSHPLEGLYGMATALDGLRLQPGDTIGHGLAAGWDVDFYDRSHAPKRMITLGRLFDTILWTRSAVSRLADAGSFLQEADVLEDLLRVLFAELYVCDGSPLAMPPLPVLAGLFDRRCGPTPAKVPPAREDPAASIFRQEAWHPDVERNRRRLAPMSQHMHMFRRVSKLTKALQASILARLDDRGVAIELNPSSNYRVSGVDRLRDIPIVPLLDRMAGSIAATLNTDDPGVFGSRIENEYAVLLAALREAEFPRQKAVDLLERLRHMTLQRSTLGGE